jgi:hypothetical protein
MRGVTMCSETGMKSLRRIAAGRLNRRLRGMLTPAGRQRLREAALKHEPWKNSTGPRTAAGKLQAVMNGKRRQRGVLSVHEVRAGLADLPALFDAMREARRGLT